MLQRGEAEGGVPGSLLLPVITEAGYHPAVLLRRDGDRQTRGSRCLRAFHKAVIDPQASRRHVWRRLGALRSNGFDCPFPFRRDGTLVPLPLLGFRGRCGICPVGILARDGARQAPQLPPRGYADAPSQRRFVS